MARAQTLVQVEVEVAEALEQEEVSNDQNFTQICLMLIESQGRGGFQRDNGPPSAVLGERLSLP